MVQMRNPLHHPVFAFLHWAGRQDARSPRTYVLRLIVLGATLMAVKSAREAAVWSGAPGLDLFEGIIWTDFVLICLAGPCFFAWALAEERESGQLNLLKATSLRPTSILLGKALSMSVRCVLLLLAQLPFTVFAVLLGGVSARQIIAAYATLSSSLVAVCALGVLASVVIESGFAAAGATGVAVIAVLLALGPVSFSPAARLADICGTGFAGRLVGGQVLSALGFAVCLFVVARVLFEPFTRERVESAPGRAQRTKGRSWWQRFSRPGRAWIAPFAWRDFYFVAGGKAAMLLKTALVAVLAGALVWSVGWEQGWSDWAVDNMARLLIRTGFFIALMEAGYYATQVFEVEIQNKTLASLYCLPVPFRTLVLQKSLACAAGVIPSLLLIMAGCVLAPAVLLESLGDGHSWFMVLQCFPFLYYCMFVSLSGRANAFGQAILVLLGVNIACAFAMGRAHGPRLVGYTVGIVVLCVLMHDAIGTRIKTLAGEL